MKYTVLEQQKTIKIQAYGKILEEAFGNTALAISSLMVKKVHPKMEKYISVGADDLKSLLYIFLEELLFLVDTEEFFVNDIKSLTIKKQKGYTLNAYLLGDKRRESYEFLKEVKAVTYKEMEIHEEKGKAFVQVNVEF